MVKLKSLTDTFLITNTNSIDEAEECDRHVLYHQYTLHWRSLRVWQVGSWSPILRPLKKLYNLTETYLITNTPSIEEAEEFYRHILDHQYSLHWWNWRVYMTRSWSPIPPPLNKQKGWQTHSWSPILIPLMKLKSVTDTFFITNTPSIEEAEVFDRHVLDHQYYLQ